MNNGIKVRSALISVFYKDGLSVLVDYLAAQGVTLYSTGGTQKYIEDLGYDVVPVEALTSYPSILGGRVKTLHPKIFGGILGRRDNDDDMGQMQEFQIPEIDLVIVDLYPFEETVAAGGTESEIIEKIDIGGVSLIRAAAKNHKDVVILSSKNQYDVLLAKLEAQNCETSLEDRKEFAKESFEVTSHYDSAIYKYFLGEDDGALKVSESASKALRYGENPHQKGAFYGAIDELFTQLNGKELSYNNLLDTDAAVALMEDFEKGKPCVAILKHNNACGLSVRDNVLQAWTDALAADPVSAFGGVIITNTEVDEATANEINNIFFEILIAPSYTKEALAVLTSKKNRIVLVKKQVSMPKQMVRTALNGFLVQDRDNVTDVKEDFKNATTKQPTAQELLDLEFANKLVKHTKSNAIILAKNGQLLASGTGQTSRVDALQQAIAKANHFKFDLNGAVMASDAFFPFPDCVEIASNVGVKCVIQPGGSIKDQLSIDFCNEHDISMVFTGNRHFKH